jgi:hypothetical protein
MDTSIKGKTLAEEVRVIDPQKLDELATAIGTPTGTETATLVPYFGPTLAAGEQRFVDDLGLDLARALLGGLEYEWSRPFKAGETIHARVFVEDAYEKSSMVFAIVACEFTDADGGLIQRHRATFIERGAA